MCALDSRAQLSARVRATAPRAMRPFNIDSCAHAAAAAFAHASFRDAYRFSYARCPRYFCLQVCTVAKRRCMFLCCFSLAYLHARSMS